MLELIPVAAVPPFNIKPFARIKLYGSAMILNVDVAVTNGAQRLLNVAILLDSRTKTK
jgi:hypothetical protein